MDIIHDYTDKSFVITGDTKPHANFLKSLGGRYNPHLTVDGEKVSGWVFSKNNPKKDQILSLMSGALLSGMTSGKPLEKSLGNTFGTSSGKPVENTFEYWEFTPLAYGSRKTKIKATVADVEYIVESVPETGWLILTNGQNTLYAYLIGGTWKADPLVIPPPKNLISFSE